jgi:hypothetical protein
MVGPSVGTAKASPVNRVQRDRRVDIEFDPLAQNILKPIPLACGLVHANEFDTRNVADDPSQQKQLSLQKGKTDRA